MREILFRGKRTDNHQWVEGFYIIDDLENPNPYIIDRWKHRVAHKTVGQYTGLKDKNGKRIFEGDIIRCDNGKQVCFAVVKFGEYFPRMFYRMLDLLYPRTKHIPAKGFYATSVDKQEDMILFQSPCIEVIGNIHDNPDFLEVSE